MTTHARCRALALALLTSCAPATPQRPTAAEPTAGAVTSIVPTEADARVSRVEDLLRGRVPGLTILPLANGTYTLRIRGAHSLRGSAADEEPLLVIDGMPTAQGSLGTTLAGLAPRDVARIDVLRDVAATGAYGSRGANGVIIITTKRASEPHEREV